MKPREPGVSNDATERKAMMRLFNRPRIRTSELPGVRDLFREAAATCSEAVRQGVALDITVELEAIEQETTGKLSERQHGVINVSNFFREFPMLALVRLDSVLLYRALDAMYGGDPSARREAPSRPLSPLENTLAISLARAFFAGVLPALGVSSEGTSRVIDEINPQLMGGSRAEYVVVTLRIVEFGDSVVLALPETAFDRLRDQLATQDTQETLVFDPVWTQDLKRNVSSTNITLRAAIEGPRLPLSAIAQLRPGSLIELDLEAMKHVVLTSQDQPVFAGRLGQSRGMFTVFLERPAKTTEE